MSVRDLCVDLRYSGSFCRSRFGEKKIRPFLHTHAWSYFPSITLKYTSAWHNVRRESSLQRQQTLELYTYQTRELYTVDLRTKRDVKATLIEGVSLLSSHPLPLAWPINAHRQRWIDKVTATLCLPAHGFHIRNQQQVNVCVEVLLEETVEYYVKSCGGRGICFSAYAVVVQFSSKNGKTTARRTLGKPGTALNRNGALVATLRLN